MNGRDVIRGPPITQHKNLNSSQTSGSSHHGTTRGATIKYQISEHEVADCSRVGPHFMAFTENFRV